MRILDETVADNAFRRHENVKKGPEKSRESASYGAEAFTRQVLPFRYTFMPALRRMAEPALSGAIVTGTSSPDAELGHLHARPQLDMRDEIVEARIAAQLSPFGEARRDGLQVGRGDAAGQKRRG